MKLVSGAWTSDISEFPHPMCLSALPTNGQATGRMENIYLFSVKYSPFVRGNYTIKI